MLLFFFCPPLCVPLPIPGTCNPSSGLCKWTSGQGHVSKQRDKKNLLLVGTIPANCPPLSHCTAWQACLGPLNRFWPFVCWEQRKTPNSQLSSGHGPNDRRSSSARWKRLEGLCAGSSNHGAPLPTAHLLSGAHQVTSALGWRSGANRAIAAEPRRIQPFRRLLGCSGPRVRAERSMSH